MSIHKENGTVKPNSSNSYGTSPKIQEYPTTHASSLMTDEQIRAFIARLIAGDQVSESYGTIGYGKNLKQSRLVVMHPDMFFDALRTVRNECTANMRNECHKDGAA